ncbi:MAG: hypothetical protein KA064_02775 [Firmicutes bacterium]|nr:hypothetical protein [Bacillota bacterium]
MNVSAPNPNQIWVAGNHHAPPPIFWDRALYVETLAFERRTDPIREGLAEATRIGVLIFTLDGREHHALEPETLTNHRLTSTSTEESGSESNAALSRRRARRGRKEEARVRRSA